MIAGGFLMRGLIFTQMANIKQKKNEFDWEFDFRKRNYSYDKRMKEDQRKGYVYFIATEDDKFVKIGKALSVIKRLETLQCGCPYRLKCIALFSGYSLVESYLHRTYKHLKKRGEWFILNDEIISMIDRQPSTLSLKSINGLELDFIKHWENI